MYSPSIKQLISAFTRLPTVGPRTAERFVFYLLKSGKKEVVELVLALQNLIQTVKSCEECFDFADKSPCPICADKKRNHNIICVVKESQDLQAIEKTAEFSGVFHILRGTLRADQDKPAEHLKTQELFERVAKGGIEEIILALNPDLPGETTMLYIEKRLKEIQPTLTISRLARGLPMGSDLQYADEITLGSALKNRQPS